MANISNFITPISTGGGGGGIPETAIFDTAGRHQWIVPQSVQDEIAAEGHAEVGLLMVGGGGSANSGEVISELYPLTTMDYDPVDQWPNPNTPAITVQVGGPAADTGITHTMADPATTINRFTGASQTDSQGFSIPPSVPNRGVHTFNPISKQGQVNGAGTEFPFINSITYATVNAFSGIDRNYVIDAGSVAVGTDFTTEDGTVVIPTIDETARTVTFAQEVLFNGTITYTASNDPSRGGRVRVTYSSPGGNQALITTTTLRATQFQRTTSWTNQSTFVYSLPDTVVRQARHGNSGTTALNNFPNNPTSTEGYLGFARQGSTRPGSSGQIGYVQIFYS